jgi:hypothetical protein
MRKSLAMLILLVPVLGLVTAIVCGSLYFFAGITLISSPVIYAVGIVSLLVTAVFVPLAASDLDL